VEDPKKPSPKTWYAVLKDGKVYETRTLMWAVERACTGLDEN